jgi:hypothetical protein
MSLPRRHYSPAAQRRGAVYILRHGTQ